MEVYGAIGGAILLALAILEAALRVFGKKSLLDLFKRPGSAETPQLPIQVTVTTPPIPAIGRKPGEPTPWLGRPATLGTSFVGREDDMRTLGSLLGQHQGVVLCGGAGTGKSRLAAELTHARGGRGFWANGAGTAERTLGGLAVAFGIDAEGKDDAGVAAEVRRCLAAEASDALVVFDNVPDLTQTNALLDAAGPTRVLITTRDVRTKPVDAHVGRHVVEVLDSQGAVALLEGQAPRYVGDESLAAIAGEVGRLPLALTALGATLREGVRSPGALLDALRSAPNPAVFRRLHRRARRRRPAPPSRCLRRAHRGVRASLRRRACVVQQGMLPRRRAGARRTRAGADRHRRRHRRLRPLARRVPTARGPHQGDRPGAHPRVDGRGGAGHHAGRGAGDGSDARGRSARRHLATGPRLDTR